MADEVGSAPVAGAIEKAPDIGIGMLGYAFICEMPIARSRAEAKTMLDAVQQAGVKHMVSFTYRFVPAIRQAYELIKNGALGEIYYFRAVYLQEWITDPDFPMVWRLDKHLAGSGALGELGAHIIDLARFLVGEPATIIAQTKTFIKERPLWQVGMPTLAASTRTSAVRRSSSSGQFIRRVMPGQVGVPVGPIPIPRDRTPRRRWYAFSRSIPGE